MKGAYLMLLIKKEVVKQFTNYAEELLPDEACGLFIANNNEQEIDIFIPIPNISKVPHQFKFDPKVFIPVLHDIEKDKKKWLGVIHSHPTSKAYPSEKDINNWFYPHLSYWIYSIRDQDLKAYYIKDKDIAKIKIKYVFD